ncbi:hypothetical protein [Pacificibacter sp. AS14]|uniref:hypothetical protein n=1 Tax=Pacificibacter sp. AS14 TaxID=3135785 RepID=UPI00316CD9D4
MDICYRDADERETSRIIWSLGRAGPRQQDHLNNRRQLPQSTSHGIYARSSSDSMTVTGSSTGYPAGDEISIYRPRNTICASSGWIG